MIVLTFCCCFCFCLFYVLFFVLLLSYVFADGELNFNYFAVGSKILFYEHKIISQSVQLCLVDKHMSLC